MSARAWKAWSWGWLAAALVAHLMNQGDVTVFGLLVMSAIYSATGAILAALEPASQEITE